MTRSTPAALCVAAALLAACATDPGTSPGAADPALPNNNPQITVLDPNLQRGIGFGQSVVVPAGAGPMRVQVEMRNLSNYEYLVDYRYLFYDAQGLQLEPAMSWRQVSLLPKQLQMISANALDTKAVNWRLEVKWAR
jgi:uncharacterized protein YcfL